MISRAVVRTSRRVPRSAAPACPSGQLSVDIGQRPEENQVSRTSGSCTAPWRSSSSMISRSFGIAHAGERERQRAVGDVLVAGVGSFAAVRQRHPALVRPLHHLLDDRRELRPARACRASRPSGSRHTGIRCPHQSCRLMHQSRMFSCQVWNVLAYRGGVEAELAFPRSWHRRLARCVCAERCPRRHRRRSPCLRPSPRTGRRPSRSSAAPASRSSVTLQYHWSLRYGSIGTWLR